LSHHALPERGEACLVDNNRAPENENENESQKENECGDGSRRPNMLFMLFSPLPGGAVKISMRIPLLDATNEPPDRGSIGDVGTGRAGFRLARVEKANHATAAVEDKRARVSLGGKRAEPWAKPWVGLLIVVVYGEFDGFDTFFIAKEGLETCIASNGEVSSRTIFEDDKAGLAVAIEQVRFGQELSCDDAVDPELTKLRILETRPTVTPRVHHPG
jgi:hypothetical protein